MTANEYGNSEIRVGVGSDIEGVSLFAVHPITGEPVRLLKLEPDFARRIAESLTLRSFECEDARREAKSPGEG